MKLRVLILFLIASLTSCSQTDDKYVGEYILNCNSSAMKQNYRFKLNSNGTFEFEQHWVEKGTGFGIPSQTESTGVEKGRGTWELENNLIMLSCNYEIDITQDYRLDFDNTKVRIVNDSIISFDSSKLFWVENMIFKRKI